MLCCGLNTQMEVSTLCLDSQVLSITQLHRTPLEMKRGLTKIVRHLHSTSLSPPSSHSSPEKQLAGSLCSRDMSRLSASNRSGESGSGLSLSWAQSASWGDGRILVGCKAAPFLGHFSVNQHLMSHKNRCHVKELEGASHLSIFDLHAL